MLLKGCSDEDFGVGGEDALRKWGSAKVGSAKLGSAKLGSAKLGLCESGALRN
jgi:hypothetical protein